MAKKHRANEVRLFGGVRRDRRALMMTTALQATALLVEWRREASPIVPQTVL